MYDVIIVGGGPVGMLVAGELALHDVSALVLESRGDVSEHPKAGTYHARAIATLIRRGIITFPRQTGDHTKITSEPFQFAGYPWLTMRGRTIDGPVMLGIAQADLERAITARAVGLGAALVREKTVVSVTQDADHATVVATTEDGETDTYTARFVVGADGGRSIVRRSGDFPVREYEPTMRALLGLAGLPHPEQLRPGWSHTPRGWTLLNLNRYGDSRVIAFEFDGPVGDRNKPVTPHEFSTAVERVTGSPVELTAPHYLNRFSDFSRIALDYRDRRLFLAGDAAHIHYPLGGQGLNTGISDAVNLGWKLAAVVTGAAQESLLDTYSAERQPVGQWVIENTRVQSMLMNPDPAHDPLRSTTAQMLCSGDARDWLADKVNGTSLRYEVSTTSDPDLDGLFLPDHEVVVDGTSTSIGQLLQTGRLAILVAARITNWLDLRPPTKFTDLFVVEGLPEEYPDVIALRPDGYVAWAGAARDTPAMYKILDTHFGFTDFKP